jgi:hypothetical protein
MQRLGKPGLLTHIIGVMLLLGVPSQTAGQADPFNFQFNSGQAVAPFFDGWSRNPDGTYEMHFGYINRNYVEELHLPVGPRNMFDPGDVDRAQPTFFYPRVHRKVFSVTVPADWGDRELVWGLTTHDERHEAVGWLDPVWEIDPILNGRAPTDEQKRNQPPTLTVSAASNAISQSSPLTLTATVSDDGIPASRTVRLRARGQETPPTLQPAPDDPQAPVNVPALRGGSRPSEVKIDDRLSITWTVLRGPASVDVKTDGESAQGGTVTTETMTATFKTPGDYLLRARLSDGHLTDSKEIAVTVSPGR